MGLHNSVEGDLTDANIEKAAAGDVVETEISLCFEQVVTRCKV